MFIDIQRVQTISADKDIQQTAVCISTANVYSRGLWVTSCMAWIDKKYDSRGLRSFEIRFRIELPIRDSIHSDDPIQNFRIVRTVNRPL